jgi:hypothetical protein
VFIIAFFSSIVNIQITFFVRKAVFHKILAPEMAKIHRRAHGICGSIIPHGKNYGQNSAPSPSYADVMAYARPAPFTKIKKWATPTRSCLPIQALLVSKQCKTAISIFSQFPIAQKRQRMEPFSVLLFDWEII